MGREETTTELTEPGGRTRLYVTAPLGEGASVPAGEGQAHYPAGLVSEFFKVT